MLLFPLLFVIFLFRDPQRQIPPSPLAVVSPVQGIVTALETVDDHWLKRQGVTRHAKRITIKMSGLDVYSVRSPTEGKVMEQWSKRRDIDGAKDRFAFWIRTDEGDDVVTVFALGALASRFFRSYVQSGERLGQGQRCGYLCFGGTVDIFVPSNAKLNVEIGQSITSGEGILAYLVHRQSASMINDNNPHGEEAVVRNTG